MKTARKRCPFLPFTFYSLFLLHFTQHSNTHARKSIKVMAEDNIDQWRTVIIIVWYHMLHSRPILCDFWEENLSHSLEETCLGIHNLEGCRNTNKWSVWRVSGILFLLRRPKLLGEISISFLLYKLFTVVKCWIFKNQKLEVGCWSPLGILLTIRLHLHVR